MHAEINKCCLATEFMIRTNIKRYFSLFSDNEHVPVAEIREKIGLCKLIQNKKGLCNTDA
jgi:hypothetical protein